MNNSQGNVKVSLDILAQIILSSLTFAQECFIVKLISPGEGGTLPMFGYMGAAEGLKSLTCLGQKYSKNPTLCRTTDSISRPCLGQERKYFHHVIQDKETRPTGTICSVNARMLQY